MSRLLLFFIVLCLQTVSAHALEYSYSTVNPFNGSFYEYESVLLNGEIKRGDYDKLLNFVQQDIFRYENSRGIVLSSPGGDIEEAIKIARFVKNTYKEAFVGQYAGKCISACFFIYASAIERLGDFRKVIGIHRPYIDPSYMKAMSLRDAELYQKNILNVARQYLQDMDVPTRIIDIMFQNASTEVHWLTQNDLDEVGLRLPWYEQFLISKCGLDKTAEKEYFKSDNNTYLVEMRRIEDCAEESYSRDRGSYIKSELSNLKGRRVKSSISIKQ